MIPSFRLPTPARTRLSSNWKGPTPCRSNCRFYQLPVWVLLRRTRNRSLLWKELKTQEGELPMEDDLPARQQPKIDDQLIQFELWDGSQISGKVQVDAIVVSTSFGELQVPVGKIRKILPGLDSYPELKNRIDGLVAQLADKDFDKREAAQRELLDMGLLSPASVGRPRPRGVCRAKKATW